MLNFIETLLALNRNDIMNGSVKIQRIFDITVNNKANTKLP